MNDLPGIEIAVIAVGSILFLIYKLVDVYKLKYKSITDSNREIFLSTLKGLSSDKSSERISSAILLRRFLNPATSVDPKRLPYKKEALNIIASLLRIEKYSEFQKTLADSLSYVDTMEKQDMQGTNIQDAYIEPKQSSQIDMTEVDFFMADFSYASLNHLKLHKTKFCQANFFQTRFKWCDLTEANFKGADLYKASFGNCELEGALFLNAKNIPEEIFAHLDKDGVWRQNPTTTYQKPQEKKKVFISCMGTLTLEQTVFLNSLINLLEECGVEYERYTREKYRKSGQIGLIRNEMAQCNGAIIVGFKSILVEQGQFRPNSEESRKLTDINISTPWSGIEAGMALAIGKPVLIITDEILSDGIFDPEINDKSISRSTIATITGQELEKWIGTL